MYGLCHANDHFEHIFFTFSEFENLVGGQAAHIVLQSPQYLRWPSFRPLQASYQRPISLARQLAHLSDLDSTRVLHCSANPFLPPSYLSYLSLAKSRSSFRTSVASSVKGSVAFFKHETLLPRPVSLSYTLLVNALHPKQGGPRHRLVYHLC